MQIQSKQSETKKIPTVISGIGPGGQLIKYLRHFTGIVSGARTQQRS